jgi:hypothetical protein
MLVAVAGQDGHIAAPGALLRQVVGLVLVHVDEKEAVERRRNLEGARRASLDHVPAFLGNMHACAAKAVDLIALQLTAFFSGQRLGIGRAVFLNDLKLDL